ncbi:MAG: S1/P1 nuclease [Pirellulales bacterium]
MPKTVAQVDNVIQALKFSRKTLLDPKTSPADRALALAWLIHLTGDLHQPLHSTSLYSKELYPTGDQGGNLVYLMQRTNLHALWDGFLGGKATVAEARNDALVLAADEELKAAGEKAAESLDVEQWMRESRDLVQAVVYADELIAPLRKFERLDDLKKSPIGLSESYLKTGGAVAKKRAVEAGFRLGAILKEVAAAQANEAKTHPAK